MKMKMKMKDWKTWMRKGAGSVLMLLLILVMSQAVMAAPKVKSIEYEGKGKFEISFKKKVQYKNLKITVKDNKGKKYRAKITEKDHDDVTFKISGYKRGRTYSWKLKGIRVKGKGKYTSVKGKASIPAAPSGIAVKDVNYDHKDKEVEIEFDVSVEWKDAKLTISDGKTEYVKSILEKDKDGIELKVGAMQTGQKYTCKISGIRKKGSEKYKTISFDFKAKDD